MQNIELFKNFLIFQNLDTNGLKHVLSCLEAKEISYKKDDIIYRYMDNIIYSGVVVSGIVRASTFNSNGTEHNIQFFKTGETFAEAFACVPSNKSILQVTAQSDCKVIFLKLSNLMAKYAVECPYASQVTSNVLKIVAERNIFQVKKTQILNQKKIRDKLKLFLIDLKTENNVITLPFNRQQLADYLSVERSALSREMSKMQSENIIKFHKNTITILNEAEFKF